MLWAKQVKDKRVDVIDAPKASFSVQIVPQYVTIKKTADMVEFLKSCTYSASRVNTYLQCSLKFYYQYVLGLREKDDLLDDPEASHIGSFIHGLLEETFRQFQGRKPLIDKKFRNYFSAKMDEKFEKEIATRMKSDSFLLKKIIENRMVRFLDNESVRNVAKLICLEENRTGLITLNNLAVKFRHTIDRIDEFQDKSIVIIDYKTGSTNYIPKKFEALSNMEMHVEAIREDIKSFQLPIYYYFSALDFPNVDLNAELYSLRTLERKAFISDEGRSKKDKIMAICLKALEIVFAEMFDPEAGFKPNKDENKCQYCPFTALCR